MFFSVNTYAVMSAQSLYEQGMKAFNTGNYGSSELLFRKLVEMDGDEYHDVALFHLALSVFHQKKYKSAIFEFNRFLLTCTSANLCSEAVFWIAESYYYLNNYIKSIEEYKKFISQSKNNGLKVSAWDKIADIYFVQGRYDEALIEWKKALNNSTDNQEKNKLVLKIGKAYFINENYDEALKVLSPLISSQNDLRISANARLFIGRTYQIQNKHRKALQFFRGIPDSLLDETPFYDVQYFKAISYLELGDTSSARVLFKSFILIGKNSNWFYNAKYELGKIYTKTGNEKKGISLLEEVRLSTAKMELRSKSALVLSQIFLKKNPAEAIPYLEDSVSVNDPEKQKEVLLLLGTVYIEVKKYEDAERILELLLNKYPYDRDIDKVQFLISRVYLEKGELNKAIDGFKKLRELNPFSIYINESNYFLSIAYKNNQNYTKAVELMQEYLKSNKTEKRYEGYVLLLNLYLLKKDYPNSKKIISLIIKNYSQKSSTARVIYNYAISSMNGNKNNEYFDFILKKYPDSQSAGKILLSRGDVFFKKGDYQQSEFYYRKYLLVKEREKKDSVLLYQIISLYKLGRFNEIITIANNKNISVLEGYTAKQISFWLGRSYYKKNDFENAYKVFSKENINDLSEEDLILLLKSSLDVGDLEKSDLILKLLHSNKELFAEALYYRGLYYIKQNELEKAKANFLSILFESPNSKFINNAKLSIADIYIKNGRYDDAITQLNEIKNNGLEIKKNALLIILFFKTGKYQQAIELTKNNLKEVIETEYGELIIKENVQYYFTKLELINFKIYTKILKNNFGHENYINYLTGLLYFNINNYNNSYYYLYKLSQKKSEYIIETNYYLGLISFFKHRNLRTAIKFFTKVIEEGPPDDKFVAKSKLYLSILMKEKGKVFLSKKYLNEIIKETKDKLLLIQAKNLFEYYGYSN